MESKITTIFIACHKKCDTPKDLVYLPIHVGSEGKEPIGFTPDNTGDNISSQNPIFCELTGLYWCWKNLQYDYLGLVHYRRYFTLKSKAEQKEKGVLNTVLTSDEVNELVNQYPVIVPKKRNYYIETIYSHYDHTFDGSQLDITREIIKNKYPEYVETFDSFMNQRSAYIFNMFIMRKDLVDSYCSWLFDILFELVGRVGVENMTDFEKRYAGRVSERLFNVWLQYQIKTGVLKPEEIREVPYSYLGQVDWTRKVKSFLAAKFLNQKYDKSF